MTQYTLHPQGCNWPSKGDGQPAFTLQWACSALPCLLPIKLAEMNCLELFQFLFIRPSFPKYSRSSLISQSHWDFWDRFLCAGCHCCQASNVQALTGLKLITVCEIGKCCAGLFTGKRRYDRKQSGYGGQTKPIFHKKVKSTAENGYGNVFSLQFVVRKTSRSEVNRTCRCRGFWKLQRDLILHLLIMIIQPLVCLSGKPVEVKLIELVVGFENPQEIWFRTCYVFVTEPLCDDLIQ